MRTLPPLTLWCIAALPWLAPLASGGAEPAAGPRPTTAPATRPATAPVPWHARITPWVDPELVREGLAGPGLEDEHAVRSFLQPGFALESREGAFRFLLTTNTFAGDAVESTAKVSCQAVAYRVLLEQPDRKAIFQDLLRRGGTVAQVYALCAMYEILHHKAFEQLIAPYRRDVRTFQTWHLCFMTNARVDQYVDRITTGELPRHLLGFDRPNARPGKARPYEE